MVEGCLFMPSPFRSQKMTPGTAATSGPSSLLRTCKSFMLFSCTLFFFFVRDKHKIQHISVIWTAKYSIHAKLGVFVFSKFLFFPTSSPSHTVKVIWSASACFSWPSVNEIVYPLGRSSMRSVVHTRFQQYVLSIYLN